MGDRNSYRVQPVSGGLNFGSINSITAAVLVGSAGPANMLVISSSLNQPIQLFFGGVAGPEILATSGYNLVLDLGASGPQIYAGQSITVRATGTDPTSGRITGCLL